MLRSLKELKGYALQASDGEIGQVSDIYFDDEEWTIRYLVADTGTWLPGRQVLINRLVLGQPDWEARAFPVDLTTEQIKNSPDIDLAKPVSRQEEIELVQHYQWPLYWTMPGGVYHLPMPPTTMAEEMLTGEESDQDTTPAGKEEIEDPHLRSFWEVLGYQIQARDGKIGHVEDFIVDDEVWIVRYLIIDTKSWWAGKKVLIAPQWIENFDWQRANVQVDLHKETIENSPEFDPSLPINREYEVRLYDYYGRPKYWLE